MIKRTLLIVLAVFSISASPRRRAVSIPSSGTAVTISEERAASEPVYGRSASYEVLPRMAAAPDQALVVWSSGQKAVRIDAQGQVIDSTPIPAIPKASYYGPAPGVTWNGSEYVVASYEGRFHDLTFDYVRKIGFIGRDGIVRTVVQAGAIPHAPHHVSVIPNGRDILLFEGFPNDPSTRVVRIDGAGTILSEITVRDAAFTRVVAGGGVLLAVNRNDQTGAFVILLSEEGVPFATVMTPFAPTDAVWNGSDFLVVGEEARSKSIQALHVSKEGRAGAVVTIQASGRSYLPAVSWNGAEYLVAWKERRAEEPVGSSAVPLDLFAARVSSEDQVIEKGAVAREVESVGRYWTGPTMSPVVAIGDRFALSWSRNPIPPITAIAADVYVVSLRSGDALSLEALEPRTQVASRRANAQSQPHVAADSAGALLAWNDTLGDPFGLSAVTFARTDREGNAGPSQRVFVSTENQYVDDVAAGLSESLIVWSQSRRLLAARVDREGHVLDAEPIAIGSGSVASAACGPNDCLIVWPRGTGGADEVVGVRVAPSGVVLDSSPFLISAFANGADVLWTGSEYLVVFVQTPFPNTKLVAVGVDDGRVVGTPVVLAEGILPALATNGRDAMLTWQKGANLFAAPIDRGGLLAEPSIVRTFTTGAGYHSVAWDGRYFAIVFNEVFKIFGARVTADGRPIDGGGFPLTPAQDTEYAVAISSTGDGSSIVTYIRSANERKYSGAPRVFARKIEER